ncbi:MAG: SH3 domain-containing protein [Rhodospirillaceae bacterium]|jgi:SH3-like domain-containing protein|nr:SH3 domain-containing protein [Rhodospirillaceae bacterium]
MKRWPTNLTRKTVTFVLSFAAIIAMADGLSGARPFGAQILHHAQAQDAAQTGRVSSLPIPRFVSLRTDPVNLRSGPGVRYPVSWVYQRRYLPVEITDEFDTWRRIRDVDGAEGWVHQSMLSGQRTGLVSADTSPLYKGSTPSSAVIAQVSSGVVITVDRCPAQTEFCLVEAGSHKGWLRRGLFWGLYAEEFID